MREKWSKTMSKLPYVCRGQVLDKAVPVEGHDVLLDLVTPPPPDVVSLLHQRVLDVLANPVGRPLLCTAQEFFLRRKQ